MGHGVVARSMGGSEDAGEGTSRTGIWQMTSFLKVACSYAVRAFTARNRSPMQCDYHVLFGAQLSNSQPRQSSSAKLNIAQTSLSASFTPSPRARSSIPSLNTLTASCRRTRSLSSFCPASSWANDREASICCSRLSIASTASVAGSISASSPVNSSEETPLRSLGRRRRRARARLRPWTCDCGLDADPVAGRKTPPDVGVLVISANCCAMSRTS